jgi:4-hydroxythreonine-4-phosphate dehydrogenase
MSEKMIKIGITQGDPSGIASELILKAFEDARIFEFCIPIVYGSSKVLAYHRKALDLPAFNLNIISQAENAGANRLNFINITDEEIIIEMGKSTAEGFQVADMALSKATEDLKSGLVDVLLAAPSTIDPFAYIVKEKAEAESLKLMVSDSFRIALATDNMPISKVVSSLTTESLIRKIQTLQSVLIRDFMITSPRIAILSLNPKSGINDQPGKEEEEIIIPAIKAVSGSAVFCFGPYSADTFFSSDEYLNFDAVLAMYYDQGMIAFQSIVPERGAFYVSGLPYVITTPYQTVSFDKAGKNINSPDSFREALYLSIDLYRNQRTNAEISRNPLKKQYFERGSDNEKLDLTKEEE